MITAAIDIGTTSVRLLVARKEGVSILPTARRLTTTRLGSGLMGKGLLSDYGKAATLTAVKDYVRLAQSLDASAIAVFGTSAMREAADGEVFARRLEKETGCTVEILSPEREAEFSYQGAVQSLSWVVSPLVFDLGGGSCELAWQEEGILKSISLKIGTVYLTDSVFRHDPPASAEVARAREYLREQLATLCPVGRPLIGVGGTVTSLAALTLKLIPYDPDAVHGFILSRSAIQSQLNRMLSLSTAERQNLPGIQKSRAHLLPAGTLVVDELLADCRASSLFVSEGDILLGRLYALTSKA